MAPGIATHIAGANLEVIGAAGLNIMWIDPPRTRFHAGAVLTPAGAFSVTLLGEHRAFSVQWHPAEKGLDGKGADFCCQVSADPA